MTVELREVCLRQLRLALLRIDASEVDLRTGLEVIDQTARDYLAELGRNDPRHAGRNYTRFGDGRFAPAERMTR